MEATPVLLETMLPYYEVNEEGDVPTQIRGLRTPEWKMVYATFEKDGKNLWAGQLYHVGKEPLEMFDVREQNKPTFMQLFGTMLKMEKACSKQSVGGDNRIVMDEETRRKLESLGYLPK
jgi:hypothetical protein